MGGTTAPAPDPRPALRRRSSLARLQDPAFRAVVTGFAGVLLATLGLIVVRTSLDARPFLAAHGGEFLTTTRWAPSAGHYGALAFVYGTVVSAAIAIALSVPVAVGIELFLTQVAPPRLRRPLVYLVELLAAVPSVVYGLWGFVFLMPILLDHVWKPITDVLGFIPGLRGPAVGQSVATASVILAIMVIPIITAISREIIALVPTGQKEAVWHAVLPYARSGIVGGVVLGLGRAMGETIAVALVIGSSPTIADSIFKPGYTMASVIANEFAEASGDHSGALIAVGVLLLAITVVVNIGAQLLVRRSAKAIS